MLLKGAQWLKLGLWLAFLAGVGVAVRVLEIDMTQVSPERIKTFMLSFGLWAPLVYLAVYGQPIVPLPASIMTIAGGLAFGPLWGTLGALCGATTRACGQFGIARALGREAVAKLLKGRGAKLDAKIGEHGFKAVLLVRLIPNVPFDMQNYALGFSRVRFTPFAFGTLLGMIPGSFAFVYLGYSLTDPKNLWKLGVAILVIIGLMIGQQRLKPRRAETVVIEGADSPNDAGA